MYLHFFFLLLPNTHLPVFPSPSLHASLFHYTLNIRSPTHHHACSSPFIFCHSSHSLSFLSLSLSPSSILLFPFLSLLDLVTSTAPFPVNPVHVIPPSTHPEMVSRFYYASCMMDPFILCPMYVRFLFFPLLPPRHPFLLPSPFASTTDLLLPTLLFLSWFILPFFFLSPTNLSPLLITESIHSFSIPLCSSSLHICIINCIFFLSFWLAVVSFSIWYEIHSVSDDNHFLGSEGSRRKDAKWPMK